MASFSVERYETLRRAGNSFSQIAEALGVSRNTLKSYARRNGDVAEKEDRKTCLCCGRKIGTKGKRIFCSDRCRYAWHYTHRLLDVHNAVKKNCAHCGKQFFSYPSSNKVYCCRECYLAGRYGRRA